MNIYMKYFTGSRRVKRFYRLSVAALLTFAILSLCVGVYPATPAKVFLALAGATADDALYRIVVHVRLPRLLGAILAGSSLSVAGAIMQGVLDNPLAGPNILGINSGAGLMVLAASIIFPACGAILPPAAFLGALISALMVLLIGGWSGGRRLAIILGGSAVSSILGAGMNGILIFFPDAYVGAGNFLTGGLTGLGLGDITFPALYIIPGLAAAFLCSRELNVMALGEETARALGMATARYRLLLMALAAMLAGAAVSFGGLIGFAGLIIPHGVRFLAGSDYRILLPGSAVLGGTFVLCCDFLSRTLFRPYELPVGILMSLMGGPFFIYLIYRNGMEKDD